MPEPDFILVEQLVTSPEVTLETLRARFPDEWRRVSESILEIVAERRVEAVDGLIKRARAEADRWRARVARSGRNLKVRQSAFPYLLRERMTVLALEQFLTAAASRVSRPVVRFNWYNGVLIQRLLFARGLERKPVSLGTFRFWWRFVTQKSRLMPLVEPKGIYCFYSRELIEALRSIVGGRRCLEIAAGDGTLTRLLRRAGVELTATDSGAWTHAIAYPPFVERLDARRALEQRQPQVVICSWPPPDNGFERHVFATAAVETYVVIGSRHAFASGDRAAYASAGREFAGGADAALGQLVLPPELDSEVLVFHRRGAVSRGEVAALGTGMRHRLSREPDREV